MVNKFTQKAQGALSSALKIAEELGHSYVGTEHLLLGLISQKESIASRILVLRGAVETKLKKGLCDYVGVGTKSNVSPSDMTPRLHLIIENASREAEKIGPRYIGTEHLLAALLSRRDCVAIKLLEDQGVSIADVRADLAAFIGSAPGRTREAQSRADEQAKKSKKSPLLAYGKDLTELARLGKTDPVLCRDIETERLIRILCRRTKNNPCLIGEPGVGKTAVVEGLAERIASGRVPAELCDKKIITLDISSMIAGAKFRGEFEDRIKGVVDEVKSDPSIILFVDEMHIMVGAGAAEGAIDASNILKPSLARGEIRMIGATTPLEYRTHVEKDPALERRFQPVRLEEPSPEEAISILSGLKDRYESHHNITITDGAIREAVRLSVRYIHDRFLPDKAIDLIDEAAAKLKLSAIEEPDGGDDAEARIEVAVKNGDLDSAALIAEEERALRASSPLAVLDKTPRALPSLAADHIASVVSEQTGIPCNSLMLSDTKKLTELDALLNSKIIGQEKAVRALTSAIRRGRAGFGSAKRPTGSFLFLGSTGVGKTALCKALATSLFDSKEALIKLDMSEYMEKHSVSKLIGAPPGYVGYGEGGLLTEKVRRRPYSVILFDEIEKAHPDIFHLLLQILEDGTLTDSSGRVTDFSSTVIVMTSNLLGSDEAVSRPLGFGEHQDGSADIRKSQKLLDAFRPEFLGRIDEIILFSALGEQELTKIADIMLSDLRTQTEEMGITLHVDPSVPVALAKKCLRYHRGLGARPLRREITELIEDPLAERMLKNGNLQEPIRIRAEGEDICFSI